MSGTSTAGLTMARHGQGSSENLMNKILPVFLALTAALLLTPEPARAHHGWAAFLSEPGSEITLKGRVKEFHFVNPHSVVELEVKDENGQIQVWEGELTSNTNLAPRGWTASSIEYKSEITITGFPAKNGSHAMRVTKIVLANGKELKAGIGN
jgi:hypothetical protein